MNESNRTISASGRVPMATSSRCRNTSRIASAGVLLSRSSSFWRLVAKEDL
jgi:hypothetical protein